MGIHMNARRLLASSLRALGRNKLRTGFMMLGTLIGVTALTVVVALGQGTQQQVLDTFRRMFGGSTIMVQPVAASHSGMVQSGIRTTLTLDDVAALEAEVPDVRMIDPGQFIPAADLVFEGNAVKTTVRGHSEHHEAAWNRGVTRGSFLTDQHVRASARVALVGETVVERVFAEVDPIGQTIRIGTVPFEVIGVLEPIGLDPHGVDRDNEIIIPISTMMRRVMNVDYLLSARIVLDPDADLEAAVGVVSNILRTRHRLADGEPDDFQTWTPVQVERMVESGNRVFTVLLPLVALISIVVGAGVVANVMLMSVGQRKHEIGLRKAVGARPRDIWWQFVLESTLVTTVGGLIAVGLGFAALAVITTRTGAVAGFPWAVTLLGVGVAVGVGILAGVAPANRAATLDPVDSLR
jgi:putative ABC transport system permease protein